MDPIVVLIALVPIGTWLRYLEEQTQAARYIGIKIASPEFLAVNKNGYQNAVSIPFDNNCLLGLLVALVVVIGWLVVEHGWLMGFAGVAITFASGVVAAVTFLPRKESQHFLMRIVASLWRRFADYRRGGDEERAKAAQYMLRRIEEVFPSYRAH